MAESAAREEMQQGKLILLQTADGGASWQRVDLSGPDKHCRTALGICRSLPGRSVWGLIFCRRSLLG